MFLGVGVITLLVSRPINLGRAGLFSIFCTQSNDFAIGYPIGEPPAGPCACCSSLPVFVPVLAVAALYAKTHPEYPSYLYLAAPVSLVILNPIAFVFMELGRPRDSSQGKLHLVGTVLKSIALNPVVLMTALGMLGNLVFQHQLPVAIAGVLKVGALLAVDLSSLTVAVQVLGSAFSATALFLLGLRMVGKVHKLQGAALLVPGILIAVKLSVNKRDDSRHGSHTSCSTAWHCRW